MLNTTQIKRVKKGNIVRPIEVYHYECPVYWKENRNNTGRRQ